ncbi:MAG: hypothetical protein NFCOHLIN_00169 [Gammaproteobacteria bacterium]|nr:hypothetical protein [Gammaproteobacteria bacterium]
MTVERGARCNRYVRPRKNSDFHFPAYPATAGARFALGTRAGAVVREAVVRLPRRQVLEDPGEGNALTAGRPPAASPSPIA